MFGTLRLLLAAAVALGHLGIAAGDLHLGVPAVVVFYLLSGYVIRALLAGPHPVRHFYGDRLLRLAPQYLCYLALGAALWAAGAASPFLADAPGVREWAANLLVVPLNFFMFNGLDAFTLIPPAWSLGCEIQFYLLAPWLWRAPPGARALVLALSLTVYALALAGTLHTDWFGYRLLPGVLWIFLLGGLLHDLPRARAIAALAGALWLGHAVLLALLAWQPQWQAPFNREVALGLVLGLPALLLLARRPAPSWDRRLGDLSYGVFLAHFSVLWAWQLAAEPDSRPPLAFYLGATLALAFLTWRLAERPVTGLRHRWFRARPPHDTRPMTPDP